MGQRLLPFFYGAKPMKLNKKVQEFLQPVFRLLEEEGISYSVEYSGKHLRLRADVDGRSVSWFLPRTASDWRAGMNFRADVKRAITRHRRQRDPGSLPYRDHART